MKVVYKTSSGSHIIVKEDGGTWEKVFQVPIYSLKKLSENKQLENPSRDPESPDNFILIYSFENLEGGFRWLRKMLYISEEEMKYQIELHKGGTQND